MIKNISLRFRSAGSADLEKMRDFLESMRKLGCRIITSADDKGMFSGIAEMLEPESEYSEAELVVTFGGDGTIIKAAREFAPYGTPVLGINTGHLGYLAELSLSECDMIPRIVNGEYRIDERMMLDAVIERNGELIKPALPALNEIAIANGPVSRLINYKLFCNGIQIQASRADGIIIATPTGSTAYSMSAGGPVADPSLECIIATPICPFSLNQRPVIYGADTKLEISSVSCRENDVFLTLDGADILPVYADDRIYISRSDIRARLVRLRHRSFLEVLHEKML